MRSKLHGKRERQLGAIERDGVQLAIYEQELVNDKDNRDLKKRLNVLRQQLKIQKKI